MSNAEQSARAWVEVDLAAVVANARTVAAVSGARLLPMVKAGGYGLGAVPVARALLAVDPWGFGVASLAEGIELRRAGLALPIVVFEPLRSAMVPDLVAHRLRPAIADPAGLSAWLDAGDHPFHLEVDTGMHRSGIVWDDAEVWGAIRGRLERSSRWEGVFTHFHSAESDPAATTEQWRRFQEVVGGLPRRPPLVHAANSAAALAGPRLAGDLVRPGIFLYGGSAGAAAPAPQPVARVRARVIATRTVRAGESVSYGATWRAPRDTLVATLAIGYADGVPRALSNRGAVELLGDLAPIVGRVTMDMTMVRPSTPCAPGEVATVWGGLVSLEEQARHAGTISYELLTSVAGRVERRYLDP